MQIFNSATKGQPVQMDTSGCEGAEHAKQCIDALANYGRPDVFVFDCVSHDFGIKEGTSDTVYIIERRNERGDLGSFPGSKVVPALPVYNKLLKQPLIPAKHAFFIAGDARRCASRKNAWPYL